MLCLFVIVVFNIYPVFVVSCQVLSGVGKTDFLNNVSDIFKSTVAQTLNVEQKNVIITNVTESPEVLRKRLLRDYSGSDGYFRLTTTQEVLLIDYDVIGVAVAVKSSHTQNVSETAKILIKSMEDSISSGNFTRILISESKIIGVMLNVTTNSLEVKGVEWNVNMATLLPSVLPSVAPSSRESVPEGGSDDATSSLVGVGSVLGLIAVLGFAYYCYRKSSVQKVYTIDI